MVYFSLFSFAISDGFREEAGSVIVDVGVEVASVKLIHLFSVVLWYVSMAELLANDMTVLPFS